MQTAVDGVDAGRIACLLSEAQNAHRRIGKVVEGGIAALETPRHAYIHEVAGEAVGLEGELVADDAALGVVRGGEGVDARVPATVVLLVAGAALAVGGVVHGTVLLHVSS